ncbi:type I 3-dehydroquinate dehydratase [Rubritalea marina]|uniref:type I 3-dehydroquinate dehydratase n=1 Tax=Rubritalea marina TaxID=361055 RepID=UPI00037F1D33|nr:type I 3-dehydroquinate dehydratase [Rubritalea marina]
MPQSPKVVGSVAHVSQIQNQYDPEECDIVEFRLDGLISEITKVREQLLSLKSSRLQTLITARCPSEGGVAELSQEQRGQLIVGLSPFANFVDIELANLEAMSESAELARSNGALIVASAHNFNLTPSDEEIRASIRRAIDLGADMVKIAVMHKSLDDMYRCAKIMQEGHPIATSFMGMGSLGPVSRVLYSQLGSLLNYGFLGAKETAPGQWPAKLLSQAVRSSVAY